MCRDHRSSAARARPLDRGDACAGQAGGIEPEHAADDRDHHSVLGRDGEADIAAAAPIPRAVRQAPALAAAGRSASAWARLRPLAAQRAPASIGFGVDLPGHGEVRDRPPGLAHLRCDQLAEALRLRRRLRRPLVRQPARARAQRVRTPRAFGGDRLRGGDRGAAGRHGAPPRPRRAPQLAGAARRQTRRLPQRPRRSRRRRGRSPPARTGAARAGRRPGSRAPSSPCRSRSRRPARPRRPRRPAA